MVLSRFRELKNVDFGVPVKYLFFILFFLCQSYAADGFDALGGMKKQSTLDQVTSRDLMVSGPIGDDYKIGPGDFFQVRLGIQSGTFQVNAESKLFLGEYGLYNLKGKTLLEVKELLMQKLESRLGEGNVDLTLARPKKFTVRVEGAVGHAGLVGIVGEGRLTDVLQQVGSFATSASRTQVQVINVDGTMNVYSPDSATDHGNQTQNPVIEQGQRIVVPHMDFSKPHVQTFHKWMGTRMVEWKSGNLYDFVIQFIIQ